MDFEAESPAHLLRAWISQMPKRGYGQSKKIAGHLKVSTTYVSQVLAGSKPLALEHAIPLGRYLGLPPVEIDFFLLLLQRERAGTKELREYHQQKIDTLAKESLRLAKRIEAKNELTEMEKAIFYSQALFSAVHVFCATANEGRTLEEVGKRFKIPREQASRILQFLLEANLVELRGQGYLPTTQSTHLDQGSPFLLRHHTNWRLRAAQAAENLSDTELMYTVNVSLSEKDFLRLREAMVEFIQTFLKTIYPSPSETIACFNLDWFFIRG